MTPRAPAALLRTPEPLALLAGIAALAAGTTVSNGQYAPAALGLILLAAGLLGLAAWRRLVGAGGHFVLADRTLAALVIGFLVFGSFYRPGLYLEAGGLHAANAILQLALAAALATAFFTPAGSATLQRRVGLAALVLGVAARIVILHASPAPRIDVFVQFQESAALLLSGHNPFAGPISDPFDSLGRYGYQVSGYAYPPANLYPQTLAYALCGDVRYAHLAAEIVAVIALAGLVPPARRIAALLLGAALLFHPRGLFVIEQSWNEPLLVGAGGLFLWCAATRPTSRWLAVTFAAFLSLKQYLVFFAVLYFLRPGRARLIPPVAALIALTWLPFLGWNAPATLENGLLFQFRTPFRPDGLTLFSWLYPLTGWTPTKWVALGVGAGATWLGWRLFGGRTLSGWLYAGILATLAAFLAGSQAFANYYSFLGALLLFLVALRLRESTAGTGDTA